MTSVVDALIGGRGRDWVRESVPTPRPGPAQVLIEVRAAALNRVDLYMLEGSYDTTVHGAGDYLAGREAAGVVVAVGPDVDGVEVGDAVTTAAPGAFAQRIVADHRALLPIPPALSWAQAASLPIGLGTEHDALVQAGFAPGQSVLVLGATSSVGLLGVSLAKALGASFVAATTTSPDKAATLHEVGADLVVNTRDDDLVQPVLDATSGRGVDVVLDHLAGTALADALRATRIGGTLMNIGRLAGRESTINLDDLSFRRLRLIGTTFSVRTPEERAVVYARLRESVLPLLADGRLRPLIDSVFPFDRAHDAAERLRSNSAVGKIVLEMVPGASRGTPDA